MHEERQNDFFDVPILFIVFNRIETTKLVFEEIRKIRPKKLFLASDGPRDFNLTDLKSVYVIRDYLVKNCDWGCEIYTRFNKVNEGCKVAVSSSITWFFSKVEYGIILEDDCLPSLSFFSFCEEMLVRYRNNIKVWHISGNNNLDFYRFSNYDYFYSKFPFIWGWASWSDKWKNYTVNIEDISSDHFLRNYFNSNSDFKYWSKIFWQVKRGELDTWDYQWTLTCLNNNALCVVPKKNLVKNIGFSSQATHTVQFDPYLMRLKQKEIQVNNTPLKIEGNVYFDWAIQNRFFKINYFFRFLNKIYRLIYKFNEDINIK